MFRKSKINLPNLLQNQSSMNSIQRPVPVRSAPFKSVFCRNVPLRFAFLRFAFLKIVLSSPIPCKLQSLKFEPLRSAPLNHRLLKSIPLRSTFLKLPSFCLLLAASSSVILSNFIFRSFSYYLHWKIHRRHR